MPSSAFLPPASPSAFPPSPLCLVERLEARLGFWPFLLESLWSSCWLSLGLRLPLTFTKQMFPPYLVSPFHVLCAPAPWSHAGSLPGACVSTHLLFAQALEQELWFSCFFPLLRSVVTTFTSNQKVFGRLWPPDIQVPLCDPGRPRWE